MKKHRAQLWSAYIDGEMTASEADDFMESLGDEERLRLDAELRFERALASHLAAKAECPAAAWSAARQHIAAEESRRERQHPLFVRHAWKIAAVAAAAVLVVFLLQLPHQTEIPDFLRTAPSVETLTATTQVSDDLDSVRAFLKNRNVNIGLKPISSIELAGHVTALRGARSTFYRGAKITELLYECCGQPLKIVLMENSPAARKMIETASRAGEVQARREIGGYYVALVGLHEAGKLLDLLEEGHNAWHINLMNESVAKLQKTPKTLLAAHRGRFALPIAIPSETVGRGVPPSRQFPCHFSEGVLQEPQT